MYQELMECDNCSRSLPISKFDLTGRDPETCFRCRVESISFTNPIKSGQGDDAWRHDTIRGFQRRQIQEAADNNLEAIPAWHTTGTGTTAGSMKRLSDHMNKTSESAVSDAK